MKSMIKAIEYYKGNINDNTLGYISNILRIFSKIVEIYPDFSRTIKLNFEIYMELIKSSFNCISKYPDNLINFNIEMIFLEIMYRSMDNFIYIIKNCSLKFKDIKEFIEEVFSEIQKLLPKFRKQKNKYIYRILYLLGICRILLYLNDDKTYDSFSYKSFYSKIFKISEIDKYYITNNSKDNINYNLTPMPTIEEEKPIILKIKMINRLFYLT